MKLKRILPAIVLALTLPLLTVSAHSGSTAPISSGSSQSESSTSLVLVIVFVSALIILPCLWVIRSCTRPGTVDPSSPPSNQVPAPAPTEPEPQSLPQPDPDIVFRPVLPAPPIISPHSRCRDTLHYLWHESLTIRNASDPVISNDACIYLWSALFYTAVKTLRSQDSVRRVYKYFSEVTADYIIEEHHPEVVVARIREAYRSIQPYLNQCGIDPRTVNGRLELWNFLIVYSQELLCRPDIRPHFMSAAQRVWVTVAKAFPQSRPVPKLSRIQYSFREQPEQVQLPEE